MAKRRAKRRNVHIPRPDHIARYCNRQRVIRDPISKKILGVFPEAFRLRPEIEETYLSAHWMESPPINRDDIDAQFQAALAALRAKNPGVKAEAAFAKLNVGHVIHVGMERGRSIQVLSLAKPADPGYSGVYGMPLDNSDLELLARLAAECCRDVRGVFELDAARGAAES